LEKLGGNPGKFSTKRVDQSMNISNQSNLSLLTLFWPS
jgi:hypothetical protein